MGVFGGEEEGTLQTEFPVSVLCERLTSRLTGIIKDGEESKPGDKRG